MATHQKKLLHDREGGRAGGKEAEGSIQAETT